MSRTTSFPAVVCMVIAGLLGGPARAGECVSFFIESSVPADGFVDPLQDLNLAGDTAQGLTQFEVAFSCAPQDAVSGLAPTTENFWLSSTTGTPPDVVSVTTVGSSTTDFVVGFSGPIPPGAWTTLYTDVVSPTGTALIEDADSVTVGFLPGDVDGSLVSNATDVLHLIDVLNGIVGDVTDLASCDVDRSEQCAATDILRVIDLFNGVAATIPWNNVGLGDRPCDVDAECDDLNICTNDFCVFGVCESEPIDCGLESCVPSCLSINTDACENSVAIEGEGTFRFDNSLATQDGPGHAGCVAPANQNNFEDNMDADVWACWTAPCTGTVFIETCGLSTIDTKLAVYEGCTCPVGDATLLECNDDACDLRSRLTPTVQAGQQYLVRVGVFPGAITGAGEVAISCGLESCESSTEACTVVHTGPGCNDVDCCETVCSVDPFCCDSVGGDWDETCVEEAVGLCGASGFATCGVLGSGSCAERAGTGSPGCEEAECCNTVCALDPFCCLGEWDDVCAQEEAQYCRSACGSGDCFTARATPGCESAECCAQVCTRDPFCCGGLDASEIPGTWDELCVLIAQTYCSP